ncbi:outer membrane beta-barrel family protein [Chryseobacterium sp. VAUSW3]|uniref:outer membrane beta-barrel family protein n=1 Tax=Chryseobacterium sp. VAUSW3 TaxID=2010998 RepID=UPI000B4CF010|nr:outer membrane beta-barrel family protein [Chryseobacterium sp. VAUSW3]OWR13182.1 TonB-dependent receptor [Chryseobacterium sp. VAUSW3]
MKKLIISLSILSGIIAFGQATVKNDSAKVHNIQEVLMTKKVFKKESDRFVYDISNAPVAKGSTTFDILKQTPLISTTDESTLKIAGKNNAIIYIDGKKSNMDAQSLAQFLKNTPAENIQKIEVITMPGSEFQVEASDGIINIVMKKKMTNGLNGNIRMASSANIYSSNSSSFSANYRKDKLGISANLTGSENIQPQSYVLRNGNSKATNESVGDIIDPNKNLGGYLNIDYQLTEKSNMALSWNTWANKSYNSTVNLFNTIRTLKQGNVWETKYSRSRNKEDARSYNNSVNLNYELKTDSLGSKLNLNAAYLNFKRFQSTDNNTYESTADGIDLYRSRYVSQSLPQIINNFSGMADYIQKLKNDLTVSVGGNYNKTKTDNDTQSVTSIFNADGSLAEVYNAEGIKIDNPLSTPNHFLYDENIYGLYVTVEKKFSDKFSGKIGTRYEMTKSTGTSDNAQDVNLRNIERNYSNVLPYLSLNYAINEKNNISYAFSSRMIRPSFWEINPVKNILTENNYVQNNPFVKASSSYNQELTYMFKNSYFLILNHSLEKDIITQVPLQGIPVHADGSVGTQNQLRYIRTNFGDKQEMSAMFGIQKSFFKQAWTTNFNIGVQHNKNNGSLSVDPTTGDIFPLYTNNTSSTSFVVQTNNNIRLDQKKTWFAGVNFFYVDKQQIELGMLKNLSSLDLSLKKIWNDWTFTVNVNDILKTNIVEVEDYQENGNYNYVQNNMYRQSVGASIVYSFGNQKVKKVRNIESASDEIKSRTK